MLYLGQWKINWRLQPQGALPHVAVTSHNGSLRSSTIRVSRASGFCSRVSAASTSLKKRVDRGGVASRLLLQVRSTLSSNLSRQIKPIVVACIFKSLSAGLLLRHCVAVLCSVAGCYARETCCHGRVCAAGARALFVLQPQTIEGKYLHSARTHVCFTAGLLNEIKLRIYWEIISVSIYGVHCTNCVWWIECSK